MQAELALLSVIRASPGGILELVRRHPGIVSRFPDADLVRLCQGFEAILVDSLEGRQGESWSLFIETAIPAAVAAGTPIADLAGLASWFLVVLSIELTGRVPAEQKDAASEWLAKFAERYLRDVVRVGCGEAPAR